MVCVIQYFPKIAFVPLTIGTLLTAWTYDIAYLGKVPFCRMAKLPIAEDIFSQMNRVYRDRNKILTQDRWWFYDDEEAAAATELQKPSKRRRFVRNNV